MSLFFPVESGLKKLILRPSDVTESSHSLIINKYTEQSFVIRRPTPLHEPKKYVQLANFEDRSIYVLNTLESYLKWRNHWGDEALLSLSVLLDPYFDIDEKETLLSDFITTK